MAENIRTRLSREDRRADELRAWRGFGIGLGLLALLSARRAWRDGGHAAAPVAFALASIAAALIHPAIFRLPYRVLMPVTRVVARVVTWVVCAILYYVVLTPYAVFARTTGARFLKTELKDEDSYWNISPPRDPAESARRTF